MGIAILIILLFSSLILVHEWGHFIAARKKGIVVEEFGLGFPPRLVGVWRDKKSRKWTFVGPKNPKKKMTIEEAKNHPTIYSLNLLPLGGFVKIFGEDGTYDKIEGSFASKGLLSRAVVLVAGVVMNIIFASLLLIVLYATGLPTIVTERDEEALKQQGVSYTDPEVLITRIEPESPAEIAGIIQGDKILDLSTEEDSSGQILAIDQVREFIGGHTGEEVRFNILRGEESVVLDITPRTEAPEGEGPTGIELARVAQVRYMVHEAIWRGIASTFILFWAIIAGFAGIMRDLFTSGSSPVEVAGPVGIVSLSSQAAKLGFAHFLQFGALISLNLAFINLVPFPALDGGRLLFLLIEKLRGKPVGMDLERKIHGAGFILLIGLIVLVTFKDVAKFL